MKISITISPPAQYFVGLHDYQANDPLGAPYTDLPYYPRNYPSRPPVPEVRRFKFAGENLYLTEGLEWMWLHTLWLRNPLWDLDTVKFFWDRHLRDDAGFTNKCGTNSRHSFVLETNKDKLPMQLLGIVCPGSNQFRHTGSPSAIKDGEPCQAVWNLDYDWLAENLTKDNARDFAASLPRWLLHDAWIVHPDKIGPPQEGAPNGVFKVTKWDGNFAVPAMCSVGRREIVDGFHVRENWLQSNRLK